MNSESMLDYAIRQMRAGNAFRNEEQVVIPCPECDTDEHNNCYVETKRGLFHCFKCGLGGSMRRALTRRREEWKAALQFVGEPSGGGLPGAEDVSDELIPLLTSGGRLRVGGVFGGLIRKAYNYCLLRGVTHEQVQAYRVSVRRFESRVFFPVWDLDGETTFWIGRTLLEKDGVAKTIEPTGSDKPLYGRHVMKAGLIDIAEDPWVVLVEGVFDHLITPNSYAMLGSTVTVGQCDTLKGDGVRSVFLVGDPDIGGQMGVSVRRLVRRGLVAYPVKVEGQQDPAALGRKVMERLTASLPAFLGLHGQTLVFTPSACLRGA